MGLIFWLTLIHKKTILSAHRPIINIHLSGSHKMNYILTILCSLLVGEHCQYKQTLFFSPQQALLNIIPFKYFISILKIKKMLSSPSKLHIVWAQIVVIYPHGMTQFISSLKKGKKETKTKKKIKRWKSRLGKASEFQLREGNKHDVFI